MEKVSVIIPAYNVENYICKGIESVIGQTHENIEVVIVDDGSIDNTWNIVQKYAKQDKRIKAIQQENKGVSTARNTALDAITGDYVIFLDSDDWLENISVEYLLGLQRKYAGYLISSNAYSVWYDNGIIRKKIFKNQGSFSVVNAREAMMNIGTDKYRLRSSCYKLFSVKQIGELRFDTTVHHGEDGLFVFEYLQNCEGIVYSAKPLWNILNRHGSSTMSPYNDKWLTAIDAAEKMLAYANDNEIKDVLVLNIIDRTQVVEKQALKVHKPNKETIYYMKKKQKEYKEVFFNKKRKFKVYVKYFVYTCMPIWILKGIVRIILIIKKN